MTWLIHNRTAVDLINVQPVSWPSELGYIPFMKRHDCLCREEMFVDSRFHRFSTGILACCTIDAYTQAWTAEEDLGAVNDGLRMRALQTVGSY